MNAPALPTPPAQARSTPTVTPTPTEDDVGAVVVDMMIGRVVGGRWQVERALTSGGMGSVYVAAHADTGRRVALKVIRGEVARDPDFVARFRRETGALASLSHPNVVTFLDSGVDGGDAFLVMELLSGRSLRDALDGPFAPARATRIAADICRALAAVHKAGLVHRDLKPENVFLQAADGHDEVVKLIDFGIVKLGAGVSSTSTKTGQIVGTPGYISPEQLRGQPATPASDLYAVGVMLYEMVTGRSPFDAPDVHAMLVRQLIDPVTPPIDLAPALAPWLDTAILRLMERDAAARVHDALDAVRLLSPDALLAGQVEGAAPPSSSSFVRATPSMPATPDTPPAVRSRVAAILAAVVVTALVCIAGTVAIAPRFFAQRAATETAPAGTPVSSNAPASTPVSSHAPATTPVVSSNAPATTPVSSNAPATTPVSSNAPASTPVTSSTDARARAPIAKTRAAAKKARENAASAVPASAVPAAVPASEVPASVTAAATGSAAVAPTTEKQPRDVRALLQDQLGKKLGGLRTGGVDNANDDGTLLTMRAGMLRATGAADNGTITVTRRHIFFAGKQSESFDVSEVIDAQRAKSIDGGERVRLVLTGNNARTLLVEDADRFIRTVRRVLDGH